MSTQDKARELMAKERHQEEHLQETMLERTADPDKAVADTLEEKARELLASERQSEKHLDETMLERAVEVIQAE
jgi:hypothetical protein